MEKISQGNKEIKDDLMEKVLQRDLKRSDLLNAWSSVKTIRQGAAGSIVKKNRHTEISQSKKEKEIALSVSDVAISLTYSSWLDAFSDLNIDTLMTHSQKKVYKLLPKFSFYSSITDRSHTIDFLLLENHTSKPHQLNLHSIEVVLSEEELQQAFNSRQYQQHMNYLWIAIPSIVIKEIGPLISEDYGIIEIGVGRVTSIWRKSPYTSVSNKVDIYQETLVKVL